MNVDAPRTTYNTSAAVGDTSDQSLATAYPIKFHDGSLVIYHDDSNLSFHGYVYPDIQRRVEIPRTVYSGRVE